MIARRFKVVMGQGPADLETALNEWADRQVAGTRIERVQLAATLAEDSQPDYLYALIVYEVGEGS